VQIKPAFVCRVTPFLKGLSVLRGWHHNCTIHQHLVVRTLPLSGQFMAQSAGLRARTHILAAVLALAWTVPGLFTLRVSPKDASSVRWFPHKVRPSGSRK
jgi:hypothetical protein